MIGIAVAIDYNLFSLVRFKEEFHKRKAIGLTENKWSKDDIRHAELESSAIMNKTAGNAVMYSGITVLIGFVSLLVLQSDFSNGMALAVSMVVIFSIITARTLTPAILGLFGRYIDWPNITTRSNQAIKDQQDKKVIKTIWTKWSNLVMKNAFPFLILGIIIILPVTFLALQTNLGFDTVKNLPRGTESRDGFEVLSEKFDLGSANPYEVIINTKKENGVFNPYVILATNELAKWAFDYSETLNNKNLTFKTISSYSVYTNTTSGELKLYSPSEIDFYLNYAPIGARKSFREFIIDPYVNTQNTTQINNTLLIKLTSNLDQGSNEAWHLVVKIREKAHELFDKLGAEVFVFGFAASFYDTQQSIYGDTPLMLTVAVILIFIALMILFRSILLPAKAIITISGSILFSLGALVYVFQQGNFLWVVNAEQVDGITFFIPVFLFTIVLGLGMDYSIFIISRIREEYIKGADPHDAVGIGLSKTANVVTSAATVMIATFIVFALAPILFLKTMGVAMSVAIFIDATVSRMILLPSAMALAGRWNWYLPKWLKKILPEIKLDH
jgi:RND superfamily putative drug exporter